MSTTDWLSPRVLPTYFVSARHRTPVGAAGGAGWQPFGVQHARKAGAPLTACGRLAIEWRMFWELPFPHDCEATCPECMAACGGVAERHLPSGAVGGVR